MKYESDMIHEFGGFRPLSSVINTGTEALWTNIALESLNVTLEHKSSVKSPGYIYSNSQKYIVLVNYRFLFYAKNH